MPLAGNTESPEDSEQSNNDESNDNNDEDGSNDDITGGDDSNSLLPINLDKFGKSNSS